MIEKLWKLQIESKRINTKYGKTPLIIPNRDEAHENDVSILVLTYQEQLKLEQDHLKAKKTKKEERVRR